MLLLSLLLLPVSAYGLTLGVLLILFATHHQRGGDVDTTYAGVDDVISRLRVVDRLGGDVLRILQVKRILLAQVLVCTYTRTLYLGK